MSPLPLFAIPVTDTVLSLVQFKVVEGTLLDITIVVIAASEHIVWFELVMVGVGVGFIMTVAILVLFRQGAVPVRV